VKLGWRGHDDEARKTRMTSQDVRRRVARMTMGKVEVGMCAIRKMI
jgi:hypothetical protein